MESFVAVYLVVCLNTAARVGCTNLPITDNTQAQDNGAAVNMAGCLGLEGFNTAIKYWNEHADLHEKFQYGGWACQVGNKKAPDRGGA
jgi:hypothetical protein